MTWKIILRDFLRGFSDADIESLTKKVEAPDQKPGTIVWVTNAELAAVGEYMRRREVFAVIDRA